LFLAQTIQQLLVVVAAVRVTQMFRIRVAVRVVIRYLAPSHLLVAAAVLIQVKLAVAAVAVVAQVDMVVLLVVELQVKDLAVVPAQVVLMLAVAVELPRQAVCQLVALAEQLQIWELVVL
jgi:hypothetical protein